METNSPAVVADRCGDRRRLRHGMVGIGLRVRHMPDIREALPKLDWLEVHPENYFRGARALAELDRVRRDFRLSLHGVGLSLGSATGLDHEHLTDLSELIRRVDPCVVSEHLSWSAVDGVYLNDLLPLPYTEESLAIVVENVQAAQNALGQSILIENPATYLRYRHSTIPEVEFLREVVRLTGCGVLCDVNNIYVSCFNQNLDPYAYLASVPAHAVGEIHLAGHSRHEFAERTILIDDHGSRVSPPVMQLYQEAIARFGPIPTLVEWDRDVPALSVLLDEVDRVEAAAWSVLPGNAFLRCPH
jgi:uncharacterized protein (UPF0276 family)